MSANVAELVWYNEDSATPLTVSKPASFAAGEILIAVFVQHAPSSTFGDMTTPSGWTQKGNYSQANNQGRVFTIPYSGGLPSTWDFPYYVNADVCLALFRVSGADTTPTLVIASNTFASLSSSNDSPSVTPSGADDLLLCLLANICSGTVLSETDPSGMTDRGQTQASTSFMALAAASQQLASSSATGVRTWTSVTPTGQDGATLSIAVKSAAAVAAVLPLRLVRRINIQPLMPQRRTRAAAPVRAQVNPPITPQLIVQVRRLRDLPLWRARAVTPVRAQVNPPFPITRIAQPRRLRGLRLWRARLGLVPMVGAAPPTAPALVPAPPHHLIHLFAPRRRTRIAPPEPAPRPLAAPRRAARPMVRRRPATRHVPMVGAAPPANPPLPLRQVRARQRWPRGLALWHTRIGHIPLVGLAPPPPPTSTVVLPAGLVPVRALSAQEIITGNRSTSLRYDLYSKTEAALGNLDGVEKGSVDFTANASIHSGGKLQVVDTGQAIDWLNYRVRPVVIIDGLPEIPLGMFVFSEAPEQWSGTGRSWPVKLMDKLAILEQDQVEVTYALAAGTVITDTVISLIQSTGETNVAVTPSTATLAAPVTWPPATTKLKIVNDLLSIAGYFSLFCDGNGQYQGAPYVRPAARPILFEFLDGNTSIYSPDFVRDVDLFGIPNKFIAVGQGDAATAALTATATNTDPNSPYSTVSRGRTITKSETGVEAASQTVLTSYARRRLIELTSPTSSIDVAHALVPGLTFNSVVRLRNVPAGVDARHVITKMAVTLNATSLVKSTIQEVVDL